MWPLVRSLHYGQLTLGFRFQAVRFLGLAGAAMSLAMSLAGVVTVLVWFTEASPEVSVLSPAAELAPFPLPANF